jgi:2-dehydropantoate 2-reductase
VDTSAGSHSIGLVGAGPVGSLLAAGLAANGFGFDWVVRDSSRRKQLERLRIAQDGAEESFGLGQARLLESLDALGRKDLLILAVKAQQVPALAGPFLAAAPAPQVLVIANGLQRGPFQLGLLYGGAYLDGGTVVASHSNRLRIGAIGMQPDLAASQGLCNLLSSSYLHCEPSSVMLINMWHKLALNCVVNPWSAIYDCLNGRLLELLQADQFLVLLSEVSDVACADIEAQEPALPALQREARRLLAPRKLYSDCLALIRSTAGNSSSMREDLHQGRETEISALNQAVVRLGELHSLPCPANRELVERLLMQTNRQQAAGVKADGRL